jgi:hypothetical protein
LFNALKIRDVGLRTLLAEAKALIPVDNETRAGALIKCMSDEVNGVISGEIQKELE